MTLPLAGIEVLDLGLIGVGPWAASLLGALGADVIKIERPDGDPIAIQPPQKNGLSTSYSFLNFYKRSAQINITSPSGREGFTRLVSEADVVMENMRPGKLAKLGFDFEAMRSINPRIIYAACPGWGEEGPLSGLPAVDTHIQAFSGFAGITGEPSIGPQVTRFYILDVIASNYLAATVMLALIARERTGEAQQVSASHLGSTLNIQSTRLAEYFVKGKQPELLGSASHVSAPDQAFLCQDRRYLAVSVMTDTHWRALCEVLEVSHLTQDERYANMRSRVLHRSELSDTLTPIFMSKPSRWWATQLERARVPQGLFCDSTEVMSHAQAWDNQYIVPVDIPHHGRLYYTPPPWRYSKTPLASGTAPYPGEHSDQVLQSGFGSSKKIAGSNGARTLPNGADAKVPPAPLNGLKVAELAEGLSGPFLGYLLAHAGAHVTKLEPPEGDPARHWAVESLGDDSASFCAINSNKKSVIIDLQNPAAAEVLQRYAAESDLVIESLPWSYPAGITPGYDSLSKVNPALLWCSITGFGSKGPLNECAPSELALQATSGLWTSLGTLGQPPIRTGADVASLGTAVMAFTGTLGALFHRIRTGEGQRLEQSMYGSNVCLHGLQWTAMSAPDEWVGPYCNTELMTPFFGYNTKDKPIYFTLHETTEEEYILLLAELGMEEVLADPRFGEGGREAVGVNGKYTWDVWQIWEEVFQEIKAADLVSLINKFGGCAVFANDYSSMLSHPQTSNLGLFRDIHRDGKRLATFIPPWKGAWTAPDFVPPPRVGEHTVELAR